MQQKRIVEILSDSEYKAELESRASRVQFTELLEIKGIGVIVGMIKQQRVEIYPDLFRDVEVITISKYDAEIMLQYMLHDRE